MEVVNEPTEEDRVEDLTDEDFGSKIVRKVSIVPEDITMKTVSLSLTVDENVGVSPIGDVATSSTGIPPNTFARKDTETKSKKRHLDDSQKTERKVKKKKKRDEIDEIFSLF